MANDLSKVVKTSGGTVVGEVRHPLNTSDFSSFLLRAQSSKAQIVGLACPGRQYRPDVPLRSIQNNSGLPKDLPFGRW
jgi:Periplasmic binding protein